MSTAIKDAVIARWHLYDLSEKEAKALVGHIPFATEYGCVRAFALLPEAAKQILRDAYAERPR